MNINLTGHGVKVTEAIKEFINDKFGRLQARFNHIIEIDVVLRVKKLYQIAEATIFIPKSKLYARSRAKDVYSAVDAVIDKLNRQLVRHKEKAHHHRD